MTNYASACPIGIFIVDETGKLKEKILFPKNPEKIAEKLKAFENGKEVAELAELKKKFPNLETKQPNPAGEFLHKNFRPLAIELKFCKDQGELNKLIGEVALARTKTKISTTEKRDKLIVQTISALNDLDKILNMMSERLREWYGLHYPELKIVDHEKFATEVSEKGLRENFQNFKSSMGMSLSEVDLETVRSYSKTLKENYELKKNLENYLREVVPKEMPNLNSLLGHLLAARLLALAGSLEKLAKMPSSTIQLLGAEKALFRFLRAERESNRRRGPPQGEKIRPPKFGILYTHPDISGAPKEQQGKIARLLASKLTLAARGDFYSKEDHSVELVADYKKKLEEVKKSNAGEKK